MHRRYEKGKLIWVAPSSVRYDRDDTEFLLPWLSDMQEGVGPAEPENGYIGASRSGSKDRAHYEAWCQVAAEFDSRLKKTRLDSYLVRDFYDDPAHYDEPDTVTADIAARIDMPAHEVRRRIRSAVSYIASGPCPRWLACVDCDKCHTCGRLAAMERVGKKRKAVTYGEWKSKRTREHGKAKIQHLR